MADLVYGPPRPYPPSYTAKPAIVSRDGRCHIRLRTDGKRFMRVRGHGQIINCGDNSCPRASLTKRGYRCNLSDSCPPFIEDVSLDNG